MIVRIATEGQYKVSSGLLDQLNELDNKLIQVVADGDQDSFGDVLEQMIGLVRQQGQPVAAEDLVGSDVILPAPDTTLEEARGLFSGEGLIPG
jgi:hypothetical protein